jgi:hypothetical protein
MNDRKHCHGAVSVVPFSVERISQLNVWVSSAYSSICLLAVSVCSSLISFSHTEDEDIMYLRNLDKLLIECVTYISED